MASPAHRNQTARWHHVVKRSNDDRMEGAGIHPQREYLASHLEKLADGMRHSHVASEPLSPTEQAQMALGLSHAAEQAKASPTE